MRVGSLPSLVKNYGAYLLIGSWILEQFQVPPGTIYLTREILRAAWNIDGLPKTHRFPIVHKLLSTIQADNIRFALSAAGFDRLRSRKRGPSMLTAENKVEEWPYHPNPQDKFTISIVQAAESKALRYFCRRCLALVGAVFAYRLGETSLLLTFDDGYANFHSTEVFTASNASSESSECLPFGNRLCYCYCRRCRCALRSFHLVRSALMASLTNMTS